MDLSKRAQDLNSVGGSDIERGRDMIDRELPPRPPPQSEQQGIPSSNHTILPSYLPGNFAG